MGNWASINALKNLEHHKKQSVVTGCFEKTQLYLESCTHGVRVSVRKVPILVVDITNCLTVIYKVPIGKHMHTHTQTHTHTHTHIYTHTRTHARTHTCIPGRAGIWSRDKNFLPGAVHLDRCVSVY